MVSAVYVVRTGTANLASVVAALARLHVEARITTNASDIAAATHVIVPGVGAFAAGMQGLREHHLEAALQQRLRNKRRATLGICLGMQLFCESSDEAPDVAGLGVVPAAVQRFPGTPRLRVPQLGWNAVQPAPECRFVQPGFAYFAHSYRLATAPIGWHAAYATHGEEFVAALESASTLLCQFHPELSGAYGLDLLRRWLEA